MNQQQHPHNPQNPGNQRTYDVKSNQRQTASSKRVVQWVYVILCSILAAVCLWSTIPYTELIADGFANSHIPFFIAPPLDNIPVIGAILRWFQYSFWWTVGCVCWLFITICELAPAYVRKDKAMLRILIQESESAATYEIKEGDDPILSSLKKIYNYLPAHFLKRAGQIAVFAYTVDLLVCVQKYPICTGGTAKFNYLLRTGQWDKFNLQNVTCLLLNLFLVEAIVRFLFHFYEFRYYVKRAHGIQ